MTELTLTDALVALFVLVRIVGARSRALGESLHGLIALLLLVALFLGFRMTREIRGLLNDLADMMQAVPGLGAKLLIIVAAWYLMRLIRRQSGRLIEAGIPSGWHARLLPLTEGLRAALLAGFVLWLSESWFDPGHRAPLSVQGVRLGDAWVERQIRRLTTPGPIPRVVHPPPPRPWGPRYQ